MEQKRITPEMERQQQQERKRQEIECDAELAVTKHFEESLRRAKEKIQNLQSQSQANAHQLLHFKNITTVSPLSTAKKEQTYSHDQYSHPLQVTQSQTPFFSSISQAKPKVSSPAPTKIYGRPERLSTDQIKAKPDSGMRILNSFQSEPPPAHSYIRKSYTSSPIITAAQISHSPGIQIQSSTPNSNVLGLSTIMSSIQSVPLDLGTSYRHHTFDENKNSKISNGTMRSNTMEKLSHQTFIFSKGRYDIEDHSDDDDTLSSNNKTMVVTKVLSSNNNGIKIETSEIVEKKPLVDCFLQFSSTNSSPNSAQSEPTTPIKFSTKFEKVPSSVAPRHLKKAWLQRHHHTICDDFEDVQTHQNPIFISKEILFRTTTKRDTIPNNDDVNRTSNHSSNLESTIFSNNTSKGKELTFAMHDDGCDSSCSDQSSPQKRKILKGNRERIKLWKSIESRNNSQSQEGIDINVASGSYSESGDSDKERMSDEVSDSTKTSQSKQFLNITGENSIGDKGIVKKRVRRPKEAIENINAKKKKTISSKELFKRPPLSQLKRTGEAFLQDGTCCEVAPKLPKCRECRWTSNQRSKNTSNIFCRFYAFRKLRYTKSGLLAIAGFCDPHKDPTEDDLKLWMPDSENPPKDLDLIQARFLLAKVADQFCDLYHQEKMAMPENMSNSNVIAWKRVVQGVREMCDVCETSLFNYHWACSKCGFVVCIDCYKARKYGEKKVWNNEWNNGCDRDEFQWLVCTNRAIHDQERLMLTQIVAGDSLKILGRRIHHVRTLWKIPQNCCCLMSHEELPNENNIKYKDLIQSILNDSKLHQSNRMDFCSSSDSETNIKHEVAMVKQNIFEKDSAIEENKSDENCSKLKQYEESSEQNDQKLEDDSSEDGSLDENHSSLRNLLVGPNTTVPMSAVNQDKPPDKNNTYSKDKNLLTSKKSHKQLFDEMMADTLESTKKKEDKEDLISNQPRRNRYLPIRVMTMTLSQELYPNVEHMWLCEGKLLRLLDPTDVNNLKIFQEQWKRGQPVLVSHVNKCLNMDLWRPESFSRDFGEDANDLINCLTGTLVPNQPMKRFWEGFDCINKRIKDENGEFMLLKLKDWPPGEDFSETLPTRFTDLMKSLPLCDYTKRNGKFNLASRLPECFVKPDLGPKMYNAYGSVAHPTKGTTNLHLDISDAVNVMVYVGIPKDTADNDEMIKKAYRAIDEAGCDILQRRRVREKNELPGALWHIFAPRDANKIRDLLNKVAIERGERLEPSHDAIHDQSWYLDSKLRERLYKEYGVEGYPIAQCLGDSVFIPAGAPHQVRNLLNCIKVAEDFVSPENVSECFHLTQEFRTLSDTHSNHEDKLQIKNIIYHAVKDALSVLSHILLGKQITIDQNNKDNRETD
ncbi:lysine-specific demethylase 3A isoform X2 [Contarinia nasturtii]|uniref:lysine-specific demethylase 3A isoform X2 n=1 Tax=Contarinia nasturtii TaxID=265458 RepID=UPI0012D3968C|nr:lysine-specific demethylase 3A isoform X2 [Contarinia nasturtii]